MRRFLAVLAIIAAACGSTAAPAADVDTKTPPVADGGATPLAAGDAGAEAGPEIIDAGTLAPIAPVCPPPAAGTCGPNLQPGNGCFIHNFYPGEPPAVPDYPFGIVADATSVLWLSQPSSDDPVVDSASYDGTGTATLWRTVRNVFQNTTREPLVTGQTAATRLVADDVYAYWTVPTALRRVRRDCVAPCTPEDVLPLAAPVNMARPNLLRVKQGLLAYQAGASGDVTLLDVVAKTATKVTGTGGTLLATTGNGIYSASPTSPNIDEFAVATPTSFATFGQVPGDAGTTMLGTDCNALYVGRSDGSIDRTGFTAGTASFAPYLTNKNLAGTTITAVAADAANVYFSVIGSDTADGLYAIDGTTNPPTEIVQISNEIWDFWLDADAIFLGDHDRSSSFRGTIFAIIKHRDG